MFPTRIMASPISKFPEYDSHKAVNMPPQTQVNLDKSLTSLLFLAGFGVSLPKPTEEPVIEIEDKWIPVKLYAKNLKGTNIKRPLKPNTDKVSGFVTSDTITVEKYSFEYLINGLILINFKNFESLISLNGHTAYCFVCQEYVIDNNKFYTNHIVGSKHTENTFECQLLAAHGMNLIRQFEEKVHCGICNIICFEDQLDLHLSSREHEAQYNKAISFAKICVNSKDNSMEISSRSSSTSSDGEHERNVKKSPQSFENNSYVSRLQDVTREELSGDGADPILRNITYLYMQLQSGYLKISVESWHTIIDDYRYFKFCFLCDTKLWDYEVINEHIKDPAHICRLSRTGVLEQLEAHFIRKIRGDYHCGLCNVIIYYLSVDDHLIWDTHVKAVSDKLVPTRRLKKLHQKKVKVMTPPFQKNVTHTNEIVRNYTINLHISIERVDLMKECQKPYKALILFDETLKIKWNHWNSITTLKNGFKCLMCQIVFKDVKDETTLSEHTEQPFHINSLTMFSREHKDNLFRIINNNIYHCMICNAEICRKGKIYEHLNGARHKDNIELMEYDKFCEDIIVDREPVNITLAQCI